MEYKNKRGNTGFLPFTIFTFFIITVLCLSMIFMSSCSLIKEKVGAAVNDSAGKTGESEDSGDIDTLSTSGEEKSAAEETGNESADISDEDDTTIISEDQYISGGKSLAYFEVGSDPQSNHFEHRVGYIYSVNPDVSSKKLIYSDLNEKYDLGFIYGASPDGKKILGMLTEGGRGLYSALAVIDVESGELKKLYEMDYTDMEANQDEENLRSMLSIFGKPVWSPDSKKIAFELVSNFEGSSYTNLSRDAGIHIIDIESRTENEVNIDVGGVSARTTTFLCPVFFSGDGSKVFAVSRIFFEKKEEGAVVGYYSMNDSLYSVDSGGGVPVEILNTADFKNEGPEIIQSFDNFKYIAEQEKFIFQVLGDFEEDGDIWSCNPDGTDLKRITADSKLREQQPDICSDCNGQFTYVGSNRYGTISSQIPSGDIFTANIDGSSVKKLTEYNFVGASNPVFSDNGQFIGFIYSQYDENYENVEKNIIRIINISDGEVKEESAENGNYIFSIAGWVRN